MYWVPVTGTDRGHTRTINSKFAHNYKDAFKAVFGEDGSKIPNLGAAGLKAAAAKLLKKHAEEVGKLTEKRQLTDFSKWFQEFTDNAGEMGGLACRAQSVQCIGKS